MILGVIMISTVGVFFVNRLEYISKEIETQELKSSSEAQSIIDGEIEQTKLLIVFYVGMFSFISILVGVFVDKVIILPITKLINHILK